MKTITKFNYRGEELELPFEIEITEEELERINWYGTPSEEGIFLLFKKEVEKFKEYVKMKKASYIVNVEIGTYEGTAKVELLKNVKKMFEENGYKNVIVLPTVNGVGTTTIQKIR